MQAFTTRGLPARRKVVYWNAVTSESFAAMHISPRHAASFDGELRREHIGALTLLDVHSAGVHIRHNRSHIARTPAPSYLLLAPLQGEFKLCVSNSSFLRVASGEYCLIDHAEPYELEHGDDVRTLCLNIPRGILNSMLAHPEDATGRIMRPQAGLARLLLVLLREVGESIQTVSRTNTGFVIAQGILGFLAAAYSTTYQKPITPTQVHRLALLNCIEAQLHDHGLTPASVANKVGLSTRRMRAVLASGRMSFSSYVLRRRLELCATSLTNPSWIHRSITEIAFQNGFNNMTHFGYAFKKHFGVTPSRHRATTAIKTEPAAP